MIKLIKSFLIINVQKLFGTLVDFPVSLFFNDKSFLLIAGRFRRESKKLHVLLSAFLSVEKSGNLKPRKQSKTTSKSYPIVAKL